jgi:two-component system, OmpR family, response regulator QseB
MHILIVEDDADLGRALLAALKPEGFTGLWVRRLADAPDPRDAAADCVLLDLSLPDGLGLQLLQHWRRERVQVPVIVITARSALGDRLSGFESGADDFIVKPFAMPELMARIGAVTRRSARQASPVWQVADLKLEPQAHLAWLGGEPLELSQREFRLLMELARDPAAVVSKRELGRRMEPLGDPLDAATIEVHLSNLRRKIGAERVRTVRGVGYQLVA